MDIVEALEKKVSGWIEVRTSARDIYDLMKTMDDEGAFYVINKFLQDKSEEQLLANLDKETVDNIYDACRQPQDCKHGECGFKEWDRRDFEHLDTAHKIYGKNTGFMVGH